MEKSCHSEDKKKEKKETLEMEAEMSHDGSCCHDEISHEGHHGHMAEDFKKRFWISLIITLPILILSPVIQGWLRLGVSMKFTGDSYVLFFLSSVIFLYGGYPFLKGLIDELRSREPGMMTLIGLAITVAYLYSSAVVWGLSGMVFFWELATLIDIMLLGHWIEMGSVAKASGALQELASLLPSDAHLIIDRGITQDISIEKLIPGNRVIVKPGEKVPADGTVIDGESYVNEALLTGESVPVHKAKGDPVIGGSVNGEGSITVEVKKTGKDSFISQIIDLVRRAQESKSKTQGLADRSAVWLTIIAITAGVASFAVWIYFMKSVFSFALERAVTVMVITCPHALGLAIPLVVAVSSAISAKEGLLIRNRTAFEKMKDANAIIFDKTGTLTEGKFGISGIVVLDSSINEKELLKYAASVEIFSEHPIASAVLSEAKETYSAKDFRAISGRGVEAKVVGKDIKVVSRDYLEEKGINFRKEDFAGPEFEGKTLACVVVDGSLKGIISLSDKIRPESKKAIEECKKMGLKCIMLTGDNKGTAGRVSEELGMDEFFAEVLPQNKAAKIKQIKERGFTVAMVGDGINDAPALAEADIGIAIGAGTDVAIETADIILVKSNPRDVTTTIRLAKATYRKMVQNLLWATGYNTFAIPLAGGALYHFGILLSPAAGAVLMSLSTVIVAINARFLKIKK